MITPLFKVTQDSNFIIITAKLKYVKFSDFDYFIENNNFRFSLKPYHLNITLSHSLNPISPNNNFSYSIETQILTCKIEKSEHGVEFENLDLISTLLENPANPTNNITSNKIEEISNNNTLLNQNNICAINVSTSEQLNEYLFNLYSLPEIANLTLLENKEAFYYGFNNSFNDVFDKRAEDAVEICDLNPKKVPLKFRYLAKLEREVHDFIPERYYYDMYLDSDNEELCDDNFKSIINLSNSAFIKSISKPKEENINEMLFTDKEIQVLKDINKTKLSFIESNSFCSFKFYLQVLDILFAFLYDCITTEYEHSSESGWTINKLSSVLSCFVDFDKNFYSQSKEISFNILEELIKNVLISCYRRVFTYPLYRNWKLCEKIQKDLVTILSLGRFSLVKCFLQIRMIFEKNEPRYLLNMIYIDPILKWIQFHSEDKIFTMIGEVVKKIKLDLTEIKLNLENIENEINSKEEENEGGEEDVIMK